VNVLEALLEDFKKAYFLTSAHSSLWYNVHKQNVKILTNFLLI
jgi:hypothetical protein